MKEPGENQSNILNKHAGMARTAKENACVYIRGLGFKARSGSRREQVLLMLKKNDESGSQDRWWIITGALCIGSFALGVVARYLGLI